MELKEKLEAVKTKFNRAAHTWIDDRIDDFTRNNPQLKTVSTYLKRGAKNYLLKEDKKINELIDGLSLFICNENGNIDVNMLFDDFIEMFNSMEEREFNLGILKGNLGSGAMKIEIPNNLLTNLVFGNMGYIRITSGDLVDLKELFIAE